MVVVEERQMGMATRMIIRRITIIHTVAAAVLVIGENTPATATVGGVVSKNESGVTSTETTALASKTESAVDPSRFGN